MILASMLSLFSSIMLSSYCSALHYITLQSFKYTPHNTPHMGMSKKDITRRNKGKRDKLEELEQLAASGNKDAKKKLAKAKRKK